MYVYLGKLNWKGAAEADNETFVVVLPNGSVRAGDTAFVFFQWTKDQYDVEKRNWFQRLYIDEVSQNKNGDDVFTLNHHKFSWTITSQNSYEKLKVDMAGPKSSKAFMDLKRVWGTHSHGGKAKDTARIWTGKINWHQYATNEMAIFIVPEGFGEGRPVVSLWQWTKSDAGKFKDPSLHCEYQTIKKEDKNSVKFTYNSYYDVTCTWSKDTDKLSVYMSSPNQSEPAKELGEFSIAGKFGRHSHDFHPPESKPNKAEVEFRLPQPQATLPRLVKPMPFPRTLFETLTHTAAFVDQAGYLAKCAEEEFKTLLAHHESSDQELLTAKASIKGLKKSVKQTKKDLAAEKDKATNLTQELKDARDKAAATEADLRDQIKKANTKSSDHDKEDHEQIDRLQDWLNKSKDEEKRLQSLLTEKTSELTAAESKLKLEIESNRKLELKILLIEAELNVERGSNEKLWTENLSLKSANTGLEGALDKLQKELEKVQEALKKEKIAHGLTADALKKSEAECESRGKKLKGFKMFMSDVKGMSSELDLDD